MGPDVATGAVLGARRICLKCCILRRSDAATTCKPSSAEEPAKRGCVRQVAAGDCAPGQEQSGVPLLLKCAANTEGILDKC